MSDKYSNRAFLSVTESAANTLTFQQLTTGISTFSKQAFIIHAIRWYASDLGELDADADYIQAALVTSNKMSGLGLDDPSVLALREWHIQLNGAAANLNIYNTPVVDDFSTLPGSGIIVPANPIFLALEGVSLANPTTVSVRIDFTVVELKADEFIELVEAMRMIE